MQAKARRDALDEAIVELAAEPPFVEIVGRLCCLRGIGDADRARADGRARRLDTVPAAGTRAVSRPDPERGLDRGAAPARRDHQDRQHARAPAAGRGGLAAAPAAAGERDARTAPAGAAGRRPRPRRPKRPPPPRSAGTRSSGAASGARSSRSRSRASSPATAGRSRPCSRSPTTARRGERSGATDARSDPRFSYEPPTTGRRSTLESGTAPQLAHPVMRSRPAHISRDTTRRRLPPRSPRRKERPANAGLQAVQLDKPQSRRGG